MKKNMILGSLLILLMLLIACNQEVTPEEFEVETQSHRFPKIIQLPNGFQPEGIVAGRGTDLYAGSLGRLGDDGFTLTGGAIYKADARTGQGQILVPAREGRTALGLAYDRRTDYLFVAGGFGSAYVYDATTGEDVATYQLNNLNFPLTIINDVFVTRRAAYFTDSFRPVLYKLPLSRRGGLSNQNDVEEIPLTGDFEFIQGGFNANGIVSSQNGKWLIVVHSDLGILYRVNPRTGHTEEINLASATLPSGDGLLLQGKTLYVVQNRLNQIAAVQLSRGFRSGKVVGTITDEDFRIPTTVTGIGSSLYAVNAHFDVASPPFPGSPPADPNLEYEIVRVRKH